MTQVNEPMMGNKEVTLYYAGLDSESFPFGKGRVLIERNADEQLMYLKALSLVADYIVVPPAFYFYWASLHKDTQFLVTLSEMYQSGILQSAVYSSMNQGTDYLQYKLERGGAHERQLILENMQVLSSLFLAIPTKRRSVTNQRTEYQQLFAQELPKLPTNTRILENPAQLVTEGSQNDTAISRDLIKSIAQSAFNNQEIGKSALRRFHYIANKCYYRTGAITYGANISIIGAERYSAFGANLFTSEKSILLAYDPLVVLGILRSFDIRPYRDLQVS